MRLGYHNERCREHAAQYTRGLIDCRNIQTPRVPVDVEHVFYQYCVYMSDSTQLSQWAIRRGIDIETTHVDVCPKLKLFKEFSAECPGAEATEKPLQLPVYSRLRASDIDRVLRIVREASRRLDIHGNSYQQA